MPRYLLVAAGQSNQRGASKIEGGVINHRAVSWDGQTDPFTLSNSPNQGGSMWPYLIDFGRDRGVTFKVLNGCIGGASVDDFTGRTGASIVGDANYPAANSTMGSTSLSGGSGTAANPSADFDPFGLLSRVSAAISAELAINSYDAVVSFWANGEGDAGKTANAYQAGLESIADYLLSNGADAHLIGLSSKHRTASAASYNTIQTGVAQAIAALQGEAKPVYAGSDLWAWYGSNPPLTPESDASTYVHITLRGQEVQAWLLDRALATAGF